MLFLAKIEYNAIMDRIVHNATTINSGTLNMREFLATHPI